MIIRYHLRKIMSSLVLHLEVSKKAFFLGGGVFAFVGRFAGAVIYIKLYECLNFVTLNYLFAFKSLLEHVEKIFPIVPGVPTSFQFFD
jgi:hypothetical protein